MFCAFCGRNCIADGVPYVLLSPSPERGIRFACVCCATVACVHCKPIVIDCDTCRRPVARLSYAGGGGGAMLIGSISPEGMMRGGGRTPNSPEWRARIWNAELGGFQSTGGRADAQERVKLVCVGKRHRRIVIVKRESLKLAYVSARQSGSTRIAMSELRR
jgi:hypothetical protein